MTDTPEREELAKAYSPQDLKDAQLFCVLMDDDQPLEVNVARLIAGFRKSPPPQDPAEIIELAICLIEHMRWRNDAAVKAAADPSNDELYRAAFDLAENEETVKRHLADAIIGADPSVTDRVRKVCLSATKWTGGALVATK